MMRKERQMFPKYNAVEMPMAALITYNIDGKLKFNVLDKLR